MKLTTDFNNAQVRRMKQQMILLFFLLCKGGGSYLSIPLKTCSGRKYAWIIVFFVVTLMCDGLKAQEAYTSDMTEGGYFNAQSVKSIVVNQDRALKAVALYPAITAGSFLTIEGTAGWLQVNGAGPSNRMSGISTRGGSLSTISTGTNLTIKDTYVEAIGCNGAPGIGGGIVVGAISAGGTITLNKASLYLDYSNRDGKQIPTLTITNYAVIYRERLWTDEGYGALEIREKRYLLDYSKLSVKNTLTGYADFAWGSYSGKIYTRIKNSGEQIHLYVQNDQTSNKYALINDIPCPMEDNNSNNPIQIGAAYDSQYYYPSLDGRFSGNLTLNVSDYPSAGELEAAGGPLTLNGGGKTFNSNGFKFLATEGHPLKLSGITMSTSPVTVSGRVYVDKGNKGNLSDWSVKNTKGETVYYCTATLPEGTVSKVLVKGTESSDWYQDGTTLCMWLPSGEQSLLVETDNAKLKYELEKATISGPGELTLTRYQVAKIGEDVYLSLKDAFDAAMGDQTIVLQRNLSLPANMRLALPKLQPEQKATFDLNGFTLSGTPGCTFATGENALFLVNSQVNGSLEGTFALEGYVYSELSSLSASFMMQGNPVYRTKVTNLPSGCGAFLNYRIGNGTALKAYYKSGWGGCLWLPQSQTPVTIKLEEKGEPFAIASSAIAATHTNDTEATLWADIQYGTITVTPNSGKQTVTFGSKPYTATVDNAADNRLPLHGTTLSGNKHKDYHITIAAGGSGTAYITLDNTTIKPGTKDALSVNAPADIMLLGDNNLTGGYYGSTSVPAIQINGTNTLTWNNCTEGHGRLYATGGAIGTTNSPAIKTAAGATMTVQGGALITRRVDAVGNKLAAKSIEGGTQKILAGSVDALYIKEDGTEMHPTNNSSHDVYKVAVTTGLDPKQVYLCSYAEASPSPFNILPDAAGKVYCWQPGQSLSDPKTNVVMTHPMSYEKTEVEVAKVDKHDRNVAPIVIEMTNLATSTQTAYGNLQDAFNAMTAGSAETPSRYSLTLLTRINNLRTAQLVPANTLVTLDLQSFEINAQNGSDVSFDASASGAFLNITGKGNIKNTFSISGDVFVDGIVPLTDAVVMLDGNAVFRTLVKDLPVGETNSYTYSYGQRQNVPFNLHGGLACLWLVDYGRSEELRFVVNGSGSSTDYTAGGITTVTQRTEAIPANPVGVVARVTYNGQAFNQAVNTLKEAFDMAHKASIEDVAAGKPAYTDVVIHLLTGVSISGELAAEGSFTLDLNGKNVTSASGGRLVVKDGARIAVADETIGMKGGLTTDINLSATGQLFIPSSIRLSANSLVTKGSQSKPEYWRTMVNTRYLTGGADALIYEAVEYPVKDNEACIWLPANASSATEYTFTVKGTSNVKKVSGYIISSGNHDNEMTIDGSNKAARIGPTDFATVEEAFAAVADNETIELLKSSLLATDVALTGKNVTVELGKYSLTGTPTIEAGAGALLTFTSKTGTGEVEVPLKLTGDGLLYIGSDVTGDHIGDVTADGNPRYRLLVTGLPAIIPSGEHAYTFGETLPAGQFMARLETACLWLPETTAGKLVFKLGAQEYPTENVTINANHYNIETYGVSDVAQIKNGKKYRKLHEALNEAAGKTVMLLKNAALESAVVLNSPVTLETGEYRMTATESALITVNATGNLSVTGKGSISANFNIALTAPGTINSNGNLQIDREVNLLPNCAVKLDGTVMQRVNVDGLPASQTVKYTYNNDQTGQVKSSDKKTLCLWMKTISNPANFEAEVGSATYLATAVTVTATHLNPVTVTLVEGIANINGGTIYDTLKDAFANAGANDEIKLRKDVSAQKDALEATNNNVTLSLDGNQLTAAPEGFKLDAKSNQLVLKNGSLAGNVSVAGNVYADGDLRMTNANVSDGSKVVWRTFVKLPAGTISFDYKSGDIDVKGCTNIKGDMACLWLPSFNVSRSFTVVAGTTEYVLDNITIASTHGNELDVMAGNDPVAKVEGKTFASLASALSEGLAAGKPVELQKPVSLSSIQAISGDLTFDLGGFSITSGNGGFEVAEGKTLTLRSGMLLGTIRLSGKGNTFAGNTVKIAGIVLNKENREVYRTLLKAGPAAPTATRCLWLLPASLEYDEVFVEGGVTYQASVPVGLSNHSTELTGYEQKLLSGAQTWLPEYANTNLELQPDAVLTIPAATTSEIHRLTIHEGARVVFPDVNSQIRATEGLRYVRRFPANLWESVALPFSTTRITTVDNTGVAYAVNPAYGAGTAGHFWLRTIDANGKLQNVDGAEMTANVSYLMAVPAELSEAITFISGANQLLRRPRELAVKPVSGFASYANGTLDQITVSEPCYVLSADGITYTREATALIAPFHGYLLADATTTTITPSLRLGSIPTGNETVAVPQAQPVRIYALPGRVVVETAKPADVRIYLATGYCVRALRVPAGRTEIPLDRNFYIVNNAKVWVK